MTCTGSQKVMLSLRAVEFWVGQATGWHGGDSPVSFIEQLEE